MTVRYRDYTVRQSTRHPPVPHYPSFGGAEADENALPDAGEYSEFFLLHSAHARLRWLTERGLRFRSTFKPWNGFRLYGPPPPYPPQYDTKIAHILSLPSDITQTSRFRGPPTQIPARSFCHSRSLAFLHDYWPTPLIMLTRRTGFRVRLSIVCAVWPVGSISRTIGKMNISLCFSTYPNSRTV
jgi:hypothetical protein